MIRLDTKNEIREFVEEVDNHGMDLYEYVDRARALRRKINEMQDAKQRYAKYLMNRDIITKEQFEKIDRFFKSEQRECHRILSRED